MPKEQIHWLMNQSPNVLSTLKVQLKKFGMKYLEPPKPHGKESPFVQSVHPVLSNKIGKMQAGIFNTMRETIDERMGLDEVSWREVNLFEIMHPVVFKSICCAMFGAPLCENDNFLDCFHTFSSGVGAGAVIIGQYLPSLLAPLTGFLFAIPVRVYRNKVLKFILPVAEERRKNINLGSTDPLFVDDGSKDLMTRALTTFSDAPPLLIANDLLTMVSSNFHYMSNRKFQD